MAINPHDDYEKLAKLLYPSIEASGNVYYGQTRKLTMDEVLKKNELGFNSHVESFRIDETDPYSDYETFLCWELGPLKGSVRVPNILPDVPMCFAKYELSIIKENINSLGLISSGQYSVYEYNTQAIFKSIEITRGKNPIDSSDDWDGANFYIETTPSANYLYVALKVPYSLDEDTEPEAVEIPEYVEGNEFTLVYHYTPPVDWSWPITIELKSNGNIANKTVYVYKINNGQWLNLTADSTVIDTADLSDGDTIKFKYKAGTVKSLQTDSDFLYLEIDGRDGYFDLKGDFRSLQEDKTEIKDHEFYRFFGGPNRDTSQYANPVGCSKIVNAGECVIYAEKVGVKGLGLAFGRCTYLKNTPKLYSTKLCNSCYEYMFYACTRLEEVSDIVDFDSLDRINGRHLYCMFKNCVSLKVGPKIYSKESANSLYREMFSGCTSLEIMPLSVICVKNQYASSRMFEEMFSGCTSLKKAPDIIVKHLEDNHSFSKTFKDCKSLIIPPKITLQSYTETGSNYGGLFLETFSGCSGLISSPIIYAPLNINSVNMCTGMFYNCSNLKNIYLYSEVTSYEADNFDNWLYNVAPVGNFYYDIAGDNELPPSDRFPYGPSGIPTGWNKLDIFKVYRDGEYDIQEHSKYRLNNYIITSGTNSDLNGKGKLSDKLNMPSAFNVSNIYTPNTYNSDGSYNQEIWGYKSFNSPAQFKNGIYSEYSEIVNSELPDKTFYVDSTSSNETVHESVTDGYKSSFEMTDTVLRGEKSPLASISVLNAKVLNSVYGDYFYSCCDLNSCANKSKVNNSYFVGHEYPDKLYLENCASIRTVATSQASGNPIPHTCYSILSSNVSDNTAIIELVTSSYGGVSGQSNIYSSAEDIYIDGKSKVYAKGNTSTDRPAKLLLSSVQGTVSEGQLTENYNFTASSISSGNISSNLTPGEDGMLFIDDDGSIIATYYGDTAMSLNNSSPMEFEQAYSIINNKVSVGNDIFNSTILCQTGMGSTITIKSGTKRGDIGHGSATIDVSSNGIGEHQSISLSTDGWSGDTHYESKIRLSDNNIFLKGEILPGEGLDSSTGTTLGSDDYPFKQIYGYLPTAHRNSSSESFTLFSGSIVLLYVTAPNNSRLEKDPGEIIYGSVGNNDIKLKIASYNTNSWGYVDANPNVYGYFKLITGISISAGANGLALAIKVKNN